MNPSKKNFERNPILDYTVRACIFILSFFFLAYALRMASRAYVKFSGRTNTFIEFVFSDKPILLQNQEKFEPFDLAKEYPFSSASKETEEKIRVSLPTKQIEEKIRAIEDRILLWVTDNFPSRFSFVEAGAKAESRLFWNLGIDSSNRPVAILPNKYLSSFQPKKNMQELADSIFEFRSFLEEQKIPFFYVNAPHKICRYDSAVSGKREFSNQNADALVAMLRQAKIPVLDLRENLHRDGGDTARHYEAFFKTDHHWKPETGLWASGELAAYLSAHGLPLLDPALFSPDNYNKRILHDFFLGSHGRELTLARANPEDISLITPKSGCDLHYSAYIPNRGHFEKSGGFDILFDPLQLEKPQKSEYYNKSAYAAYNYGDNVSVITNNANPDGAKILLIGDSFTDVVEPYLALGLRRLDCMDLRHFAGSLRTYIEANGPYDACVVLYNPSVYGSEELFDFR